MPLLRRKPFPLAEPPKELKPYELVYQVRFTKEIFQDYHEYLNRINLYRQRVWMCRITGKTGLTYEEALVSEKRAIEKVQQLPKELVLPALQTIQYSMLSLKDLADAIAAKLQDCLYVGAELSGKKDDGVYQCKILKLLKDNDTTRYEVAWVDRNKKVVETSVASKEDLILKKQPFGREFLKSFIRESTCQSSPWVLHDKLARKYGISTDIPVDLRNKVSLKDGLIICNNKRKNKVEDNNSNGEAKGELKKYKRRNSDGSTSENNNVEEEPEEEPIKYPIDDLLVKPGADDPVFTDRPSPSRDFNVPMECIGDLLMVWDFCSSFGRLLHLSPYSLEDFENALCYKEGSVFLLVETHSALLRLLIKDNGQYFLAVQKRNRKLKITLINWAEYLCELLELIDVPELRTHSSTIKRGHYSLLDIHTKLAIFQQLVNQALETDMFREKLDEIIEQRHVLGATRRGEALEEARKKREEKEQLKAKPDANGVMDLKNVEDASLDGYHKIQLGDMKQNGEVISSQEDHTSGKSESKDLDTVSKKAKHDDVDVKIPVENGKVSSKKDAPKQLKDDKKVTTEGRNKEERKKYFEREMEKRFVRTSPLGRDRNYNRYWWFRRDGRIFVESSDSKQWGYYSSKEEVDALMGSLNCKGERERALKQQLEKFYGRISSELQKKAKDLAHKIALDEAVLRRSTRVRAPPRDNPANSFLKYDNKWKEDY